jgi:hypothetical protein
MIQKKPLKLNKFKSICAIFGKKTTFKSLSIKSMSYIVFWGELMFSKGRLVEQ